jgi:hypothetical protein
LPTIERTVERNRLFGAEDAFGMPRERGCNLNTQTTRSQNFGFLLAVSPMLEMIASFAEAYLAEDPNGSLTKTRQWAEIVAKRVAAKVGLPVGPDESQLDALKKLENAGAIIGEVARLFHSIRKTGNAAVHGLAGADLAKAGPG